MILNRFLIVSLLFLFSVSGLRGQYATHYGLWRSYLAHKNSYGVVWRDGIFYIASERGLVLYDRAEDTLVFMAKTEGLNGVFPSCIAYDPKHNYVLLGYKSGLIDIITEDMKIIPFYDIYINNSVTDKQINNIAVYDNLWIVSTNFGLVIIDGDKKEIRYNYFQIGANNKYTPVKDACYFNDTIYCLLNKRIFLAKNEGYKLALPSLWKNLDSLNSPSPGDAYFVESSKDFLVIGKGRWIYYRTKQDTAWRLRVYHEAIDPNTDTVAGPPNNIVYSYFSNSFIGGQYTRVVNFIPRNDSLIISGLIYTYGAYYGAGSDNRVNWVYIDNSAGPVYAWRLAHYAQDTIMKEYMYSNDIGDVKITGNHDFLYFIPQGRNGIHPTYRRGLFKLDFHTQKMTAYLDELEDMSFGPVRIYHDTLTNSLFVTTWWRGFYQFKDGKIIKKYTPYLYPMGSLNLQDSVTAFIKVSDVKRDQEGVLWATLFGANYNLVAFTPNDEVYNFAPTGNNKRYTDFVIDENNYKWIISENEGLVVFDDNRTPGDFSDDRTRLLSTGAGNGDLPINLVTAIAKDKDGAIWVGTPTGVRVFYNTASVFDGGTENDAVCPVLNYRCLLDETYINDILIDGANRKWFATDEGLYLIASDGTEELQHFTTLNSPLISDKILRLEVHNTTGELFMVTDAGMQSYTIEATEPFLPEQVKDSLYVFPNPIGINYTGPITIRGLVDNAIINITTINGNVIRKMKSFGGQAVWDGKDAYGNPLTPGVYLVFVTNARGEVKGVAKIAILDENDF